jgi:hypothetical protein
MPWDGIFDPRVEPPGHSRSRTYAMLKNPTCANCGLAMTQRPSHDSKTVLTVFECNACGVVFYTEDHVPITGLPIATRGSLAH